MLYDAERKLVELLLVESERVVVKIGIDINNQLIEKNSTDASKKRGELKRRNQKYRMELQQRRRSKWQKVTKNHLKNDRLKTQKELQMAEQNLNEVKAPSENIKYFKLTSDVGDHTNCVSFSENMWVTDNRTERKKNRAYAEVVCNLEEVEVNDGGKEKTWNSQQRVNTLENDNFGNVNFQIHIGIC